MSDCPHSPSDTPSNDPNDLTDAIQDFQDLINDERDRQVQNVIDTGVGTITGSIIVGGAGTATFLDTGGDVVKTKSVTTILKSLFGVKKVLPDDSGQSGGDSGSGSDPDPGDDSGSGGCPEDLPDDGSFPNPPTSPLVVDLDGDGIELTALEGSATYFDLNIDGFAERTGWVHSDDGLLALDVNGNGVIDDNSELFGNATGHTDGFAHLAELDSNSDGIIDANDAQFSDLRVWRDLDQDGFSDAGEMQSLNEIGITSIDLNASVVNETNSEHLVSHRSSVTFSDGTTGLIEDIHFQNDLSSSVAVLSADFEYNLQALTMPVLWGYGKIASTWVALSLDDDLRAEASLLLDSLSSGDIAAFKADFNEFLFGWAGVDDIDPNSRGGHIDARKLSFLEKAYGTDYIDKYGGSDPRVNAGNAIGEFFDDLAQKLAGRFMAQSAAASTDTSLTYELYVEQVDTHPLKSLLGLTADYSEANRALDGDLAEVISGLQEAVESSSISAANATAALLVLQPELSSSEAEYKTMLETAAVDAGLEPTSEFFVHIKYSTDREIIFGTSGDDTFSFDQDAYITGEDGNDVITTSGDNNIVNGGTGDDTINSAKGSDVYFYQLGDGNDVITDYDYLVQDGTDVLNLADINSADVSFTQGAGEDLIITINNGDTITVKNHFDTTSDYAIEEIAFADGVTLDAQGIRDRSVADMKATGSVLGTDLAENYVHHLGDGSYTITDYDYLVLDGTDTFTFADVNAADVTFAQGSGNDLVLTLTNGEAITVESHFDEDGDNAIEQISFADGTTLDAQGIRDRSVSDMKATGSVLGSDLAENYVHALGDGSYTITDYDYLVVDGTDTLTFTDANAAAVTFSQGAGNDLVLTLSNGEAVTIKNHFDEDGDNAIEQISFADGTTLDAQGIRDRSVSDMKVTGAVLGSDLAENYVHNLGDGSYTITDYDYLVVDGTDTLTFADVNAADVTFSQGTGNDLILTLSNGEAVTIKNHFDDDGDNAIEQISFADGTTLDAQGIRDRNVLDMKATGFVLGSDLAENYVHNLGDGSYVINDFDYLAVDGTDTLTFADVNADDVFLTQGTGTDLVVTLSNGETVTVENYFDSDGDYAIEQIIFADGEVFGSAEVTAKKNQDRIAIQISEGDDNITGFATDEAVIDGAGGDDTINGGDGDDGHFGGAGDDLFIGNSGTDTYSGGDGIDTLDLSDETGGFSADLSQSGLQLSDGTVEQVSEIENLIAGAGNDSVIGTDAANTLTGNGGDDTLEGGGGSDTYVYALGDGSDVIRDSSVGGGTDLLRLIGLNAINVTFSQNAADDLVIGLSDGETITIENHFEAGSESLEGIEFADGTVLDVQGIQDKVDADAAVQASDDVFMGTGGSDTFNIGYNQGNDQIVSTTSNYQEVDRIQFDAGITVGDVYATYSGVDMVIGFNSESGTVKIINDGSDSSNAQKYHINEYAFSDGTVLSRKDFMALVMGTAANDVFNGSGENDTFRFGAGEGDDQIVSNSSNYQETDRLKFDAGITVDDVYAVFEGNDLKIGLKNDTGTIAIVNYASDSSNAQKYHINTFELSDGTVLNRQNFVAQVLGTAGDDTYNGSGENDTFHFVFDEGNDQIVSNSSNYQETDRLEFGAGITMSDIYAEYVGNDLKISHITKSGSVSITNDALDGSNTQKHHINQYAFDDGTVLNRQEFISQVLGTSGDDTYNGSGENDTFGFNFDEGNDQIVSNSSNYQETDRLEFGAGITVSDVYAEYVGNDLKISHITKSGSVSIVNDALDGSNTQKHHIKQYAFDDGTVLNRQEFISQVLGTAGDDVYNGSGENDTFHFGFDEGDDQIVSNSANYQEVDTLIFADGIALGDLTSTRSDVNSDGVDDLLITHSSLSGSITVISAYASSNAYKYEVDQFVFEDGTSLTQAEFITATDDPMS